MSRTWLSKRLLHDTYRLGLLSDGKVDIGVNRLARAMGELEALERERVENPANDAASEAIAHSECASA